MPFKLTSVKGLRTLRVRSYRQLEATPDARSKTGIPHRARMRALKAHCSILIGSPKNGPPTRGTGTATYRHFTEGGQGARWPSLPLWMCKWRKGGQLRSGEPSNHQFWSVPPHGEYSNHALSESAHIKPFPFKVPW